MDRNRVGSAQKRRRMSIGEIYESAASERRHAWQQRQRVERWVTVHIARKIGKSEEHVAALCHEFNVRVARSEATFEEWAAFLRDLYLKFNRFLGLQFNPAMLSEVQNLIILGRFVYGEERLRPVLRQLGISLNFYLDDNGRHNIVQLSTQRLQGPFPETDPVFHFLPYRHGSLEDITQRVGIMPSIPLPMDDRICPICCNEFAQEGEGASDSSPSSKLSCNHIFHSACITPWLVLNPTCPLCRQRTFSDL